VSWEEAEAYVGWLSQRTGKTYRLLSEAEWEYCCRAGTTTQHDFGDQIVASRAQLQARQTAEVGTFAPNAWGLYDMRGNVWEWCADNWHDDYKGAPQDGSAWGGDDVSLRVLRGGSWRKFSGDLQSADRLKLHPDSRDGHVGFRVARTL
jgi:formylglycine-generating enzyme required for sulfatase activity